jgi:hypothetical protein
MIYMEAAFRIAVVLIVVLATFTFLAMRGLYFLVADPHITKGKR